MRAIGIALLFSGAVFIQAEPERTAAALRARVLRADSRDKAAAYQAYFLRLGRAGLRDRMKDDDTGVALQAAWEVHLKPAKRKKKLEGRTDDVYDSAELAKFLAF